MFLAPRPVSPQLLFPPSHSPESSRGPARARGSSRRARTRLKDREVLLINQEALLCHNAAQCCGGYAKLEIFFSLSIHLFLLLYPVFERMQNYSVAEEEIPPTCSGCEGRRKKSNWMKGQNYAL